MKANYREIPEKLRNREPFQGHSMSAVLSPSGGVGLTYYRVFSYGTEIAHRVQDSDGGWSRPGNVWVSEARYSRTTSRHQNLCWAYL